MRTRVQEYRQALAVEHAHIAELENLLAIECERSEILGRSARHLNVLIDSARRTHHLAKNAADSLVALLKNSNI
jgi:hypothetical protein